MFFIDYSLRLLGARDGAWKCIYEIDSGRSRLFDLNGDPQERHDLSSARRDEARWYAEKLRAWSATLRR